MSKIGNEARLIITLAKTRMDAKQREKNRVCGESEKEYCRGYNEAIADYAQTMHSVQAALEN
jgi:hypothetical protein